MTIHFWSFGIREGLRVATSDGYHFCSEIPDKKLIFGHLTSGRVPKVATSYDQLFSRKFQDPKYFLALYPQGGYLPITTLIPRSSLIKNKGLAI